MPFEIHRLDAKDHPAAVEAMRELLAAAEGADGFPSISDQALLAAAQGKRIVFLAARPGGHVAAVGVLGDGELDLVVHPDDRGRGLGTRMLGDLLRAALPSTGSGNEAAGSPAAPAELRAWAHGENPAAETLLARAGFAPVRALLRMALDPAELSAAIAGARALPEGFAVRSFDPESPGDAEAWVRVNARSFASHPEQGAVTLDDFAALTAEPWFDPDDLRLAFDAGEGSTLAGYTWVKTVRTATETETELYVLGVDPAYAGRGLGAALLGETLRRMAAHDPDRITLYVDGDNANARALYERAGFEIDQRSTQWLLGGPSPAADAA